MVMFLCLYISVHVCEIITKVIIVVTEYLVSLCFLRDFQVKNVALF